MTRYLSKLMIQQLLFLSVEGGRLLRSISVTVFRLDEHKSFFSGSELKDVSTFHLKPLTKFNKSRDFHRDFTVGKGLHSVPASFSIAVLCLHSSSNFTAHTSVFISHLEVSKACFKLLMFGIKWKRVSFKSNIAFCLNSIRSFKQAFCSGNIYVS